MSDKEGIVRIKKVEEFDGTYYFPQKRVWKSGWFSEGVYEWECFFLVSARGSGDTSHTDRFVSYSNIKNNIKILEDYKKLEIAEYDCREYLRIYHGSEVIKVYSIEG